MAVPFPAYARAFEGRRERVLTQMHFGAIYEDGKYGWTRDLGKMKEQFQWELGLLHTDYTDMGLIHCVDDREDLDQVMKGGFWIRALLICLCSVSILLMIIRKGLTRSERWRNGPDFTGTVKGWGWESL